MEWYVTAIGLMIIFAAWCIFRVRAEYLRGGNFSHLTVVSVWLLYTAHFAVTLTAAITSVWPIPLGPESARLAGVIFFVGGSLLFVGGIVSFRSFRRMSGLDTTVLVTTGTYRWSRNPQNVGWAFFLVGIASAGRSALALLMAAAFWVSFRMYVSSEEEFLQRTFGDAYRAYCSRTRRYLGRSRRPAA